MKRSTLAACLSLFFGICCPPQISRGQTFDPAATAYASQGGSNLTFDNNFLTRLRTRSVVVTPLAPAYLLSTQNAVRFPLCMSVYDLFTGKGEFTHAGGLTFTGRSVLSAAALVIETPRLTDTTRRATISAKLVLDGVVQDRVDFFSVDFTDSNLRALISVPADRLIILQNVTVRLTVDGANALNNAFFTTFGYDDAVGTMKIRSVARGTL